MHSAKLAELGAPPLTDRVVYDKSSAYTVPAYIRAVDAKTVSATGAFTITLGPPEVVAGLDVLVYMTARNGTDNITVTGEGFSDITLDAANEWTLLKSTGKRWLEIGSNHA